MFNRDRESQLRAEMEAHIDEETRLNLERGMSAADARAAALRRFGNVTASLEASRAIWITRFWDDLSRDLLYALRTLRRHQSFTWAATAVVALSMGISVPVFSFLDRLFLRPLPYPHAEQLVTVGIKAPILDYDFLFANDYLYLRQSKTPFTQLASWTGNAECDLTEDNPLRLACAQVESSFLPTLGITPILGRNFTPDEDRPGAYAIALISYGVWQSRFAGRLDALDKTLSIDGTSVRIIGILPRNLEFPTLDRVDLLVPQRLPNTAYVPNGSGRPLHVIGRLNTGTSLPQAFAELQPFFRFQLQGVPPPFRKEVAPSVLALRTAQVGNLSRAGLLLAGAIAAIFLIQIANITSLMLARSVGRSREFDIRTSLGAGRSRIMRQVVTETVVITLLGGAIGCLVALASTRLLRSLAPASIPHSAQIAIDLRVLFFFALATLATGIIVGLIASFALPARHTLGVQAPSIDATKIPIYRRLLTFQIAVSLGLVTIAGMLIQSFERLQRLAYGFQSEHVLLADISIGLKRYPDPAVRQQFLCTMLDRLRALPGVSAVAFADTVPPSGFVHDRPFTNFVVNGVPVSVRGTGGMVAWRSITPDYFRALGIPLLRGRSFTDIDSNSPANALVISSTLARRLFGNDAAAIGQHLRPSPQGPDCTIIGVAADVRNNGFSPQQLPEYYEVRKNLANRTQPGNYDLLLARSGHYYDGEGSLIVRISGSPQFVTTVLHELDPTLPVTTSTLDSRISALLQAPRFRMSLIAAFAATALLLALSGIYGTMSYLVSQRKREIGIRMAIGATHQQIVTFMMLRSLRWITTGLLAGTCLSFCVARFSRSLLFEVSADDPRLFAIALYFVMLTVLAATFIPSLRATRIDPAQTIRQD